MSEESKEELILKAFGQIESLKSTLNLLQAKSGGTDLQLNSVRCFIYLSNFNDVLIKERGSEAKPKLRQQ